MASVILGMQKERRKVNHQENFMQSKAWGSGTLVPVPGTLTLAVQLQSLQSIHMSADLKV
jgi:hypothetical protein